MMHAYSIFFFVAVAVMVVVLVVVVVVYNILLELTEGMASGEILEIHDGLKIKRE